MDGRAARDRVSATLEIAPSARRLGPRQEAVQLLPAQARAVDEAIDRLVTDAVPRSFLLEPTGDLLGRPSHREPVTDVRPQRAQALDAGQPSAPR